MVHRHVREAAVRAISEVMERRVLFNFDAGLAAGVEHTGVSWKPVGASNSMYFENLRFGLLTDTNGRPPTGIR